MKYRTPDSHSNFMPSDELLLNPHKGFTSFQRFRYDGLNENWSIDKGWQMEELSADPCEDKSAIYGYYPDSLIAYFRIPWARLEPREGEYNLKLVDRILSRADSLGQEVMLRIIPHAARPGSLDLPEWFRSKLAIPPREVGDKSSPIHPLFFEKYASLIGNVCRHVDGDERLGAMDMSLISAWGEGSQMDMLEKKWWRVLVDAYMQNLKVTPISAQFNHPESVHYANTFRPVGFRADCLGNMNAHMFNHYPHRFPLMPDLWKGAPIAFESCWVIKHWLDMGWDIDYIIEQSLKWHITSLNAKSVAIPEIWRGKVEGWIKKMGYRFAVRRLDYPSHAAPGDSMHLFLWVENRGSAPIYHSHSFVIRLRGERAVYDTVTNVDLRSWLPGDNLYDTVLNLPSDLPTGDYVIEAGIKTKKGNILIATDSERTEGFSRISGKIRIG